MLGIRDSAKSRGLDYLLRSQVRGAFADFDTLAGASDEWVTAYVGCALAEFGDVRAIKAAHSAWDFLLKRRSEADGWGFNSLVPADADSTLWGLRLANAIGEGESRRARSAANFIARHQLAGGAFTTFADVGPIRRFTESQPDISFAGWCGAHPCVTALAATTPELPGIGGAMDHLRGTQEHDGSWLAYWWSEPAYATSFAASALSRTDSPDDARRVERAVEWASNRRFDSAFAAACCADILALAPQDRTARRRLDDFVLRLTSTQRTDGAWDGSAWLRIPPPGVSDPQTYGSWAVNGRGGGSLNVDKAAIFTTATVLIALLRHSRLQQCAAAVYSGNSS